MIRPFCNESQLTDVEPDLIANIAQFILDPAKSFEWVISVIPNKKKP
jgi:hypothetical protein